MQCSLWAKAGPSIGGTIKLTLSVNVSDLRMIRKMIRMNPRGCVLIGRLQECEERIDESYLQTQEIEMERDQGRREQQPLGIRL